MLEAPLVLFVIFVLPLATLMLGITGVVATFQFFALQRKALELRRWEIEQRMEQARLASQMPPWLDYADPQDVAAWRSAVRETWSLVGRGSQRIES